MSAINVRVDPDFRRLVGIVAEAQGGDVSSFVRLALKRELARLHYLTDSERQAVGLLDEPIRGEIKKLDKLNRLGSRLKDPDPVKQQSDKERR